MDKLVKVSQQLQEALFKLFGKEFAHTLINEPENTKFPLVSNNTENINLAIIIASNSDIEKFYSFLELSTIDWRDTLVSAGLADENWLDVLKKYGFNIPR